MTGLITRMARNLHEGFHELFPPMEKPIESYKLQQERFNAKYVTKRGRGALI